MPTEDDLQARLVRLERQYSLIEEHFSDGLWKTIDLAYEASLRHRQLTCIVCDHSGRRDAFGILTDRCIFGGGKLERYRCPKCECIFGPQKYLDLDESFVSRDYQLLYLHYTEADSTLSEVRTFNSLSPLLEGLYLDWGCGGAWSQTVKLLRSSDWDVWGYEPVAQGTEDAVVSRFVVNRRDAITARFDGIFSNNVIEHFRDPVAQFKDFYSVLKDGGTMAHSSACYEYAYAYSRFHTLFLLGRSPYVLAERTGFKVLDRVQDGEYINYLFARV